jgi:uncharacterized protein
MSKFYLAVLDGDLQTLEAILDASETMDLREAAEVLALAAARGSTAIVQCLLRAGIRPNHPRLHDSALHRASLYGHLAIVEMLLNARAVLDQPDLSPGWTPLMYAACQGHSSIVQALIQAGADLNACDSDGQTALMIAANAGQGAIALQLIQAGAQIALEDHYGNTVFNLAKQGCLPEEAWTGAPPLTTASPLSSRGETARYATAA